MSIERFVGLILVVIGVILFVVGMNASESVADQWSNFFTGRFTDTTVWYIVGGVATAVVGLSLVVFRGRVAAA